MKEAEKKDAEVREGIARREEMEAAKVGGAGELGVEVQRIGEDEVVDGKEARIEPVDAGEIDWFAYYLAVSPLLIPLPPKIKRPPRRT